MRRFTTQGRRTSVRVLRSVGENGRWREKGLLLPSAGAAEGASALLSRPSGSPPSAIILQLIFMAQREIMGIPSNVEMYVFLLVNQSRPYFKLVS